MKEEIRKLCKQFSQKMGFDWDETIYCRFERNINNQLINGKLTIQIFKDMTLNVLKLIDDCPELKDSEASYTKVFTLEKKRLEGYGKPKAHKISMGLEEFRK